MAATRVYRIHPALILLRWCFIEARPSVLAIFLLRFTAGAAIGAGGAERWHPARLLASAVVWELAVFAIYLYNGVMDVTEDRVNGSRRPIARGALLPETALRIAVAAAALSLTGALLLGFPITALVTIALALGYLYSGPPLYLRRNAVGTALTGVLAGLVSYYAGHVAVSDEPGTGPALSVFAAAMSLWMGLVGAPAKDLSDTAGDAAAGRRTIAVVYGQARVRVILAGGAVGVAAIYAAVASSVSGTLLWSATSVLGGGLAVAIISLSGLSRGNRARRRRPYRAFMVTQYAAHLSQLLPIGIRAVLSG